MSRPRVQHSHSSLPLACDEPDELDHWTEQHQIQRRSHRSGSLFSLPNLGSSCSQSRGPSPGPPTGSRSFNRTSSLIPPFRLNVDALIGAEETDVDTGNKVNPDDGVDLSVVSAYLKSGRPSPAPPEDTAPPHSPRIPKAATLSRMSTVTGTNGNISTTFSHTSTAQSTSSVSINQSDSCSLEEEDKEEDQEFYI